VAGAYVGGQLGGWLGRTRGIIVGGLVAAVLGFGAMASVGRDTPAVAVLAAMAVVGMGIGVCLPTILVMVQNAAPRRDVGTATGALLFLRSMGGAVGTTLVGAVLTLQFAARMAASGIPGATDLGALRQGGTLAALGPAAQAAGALALESGFRLAFGALLVLFALGVVVALGLRDIPLRTVAGSTPEPAPLGH
jgi:hypothetical protein